MSAPGTSEGTPPRQRDDVWTVLDLLRWTTAHFAARGVESARLDAECLLAHALGTERLGLYVEFDKPVNEAERARFRELVRRRAEARIPVAQLVGRKEFWSLSLHVTPDVLVPRPETEILVSAALSLLPLRESAARVLDVGTGSGAVALAIAKERPQAVLTATDISPEALKIAQRNAEEHGMADRIRFLLGDLLEPVRGERFDLLVSNPPYLADALRGELAPELAHEPDRALFGGPDGMNALRALAAGAGAVLSPGAGIACEIDPAQAEALMACFREAGLGEVRMHRDLAGRPRAISARQPHSGVEGG